MAKFDFLTSKAIVWKSAQVDKVALNLTKNKILKKNNENANALQMRLFPPSLKEKEKQKRRSRLAKYKYSEFFRDISVEAEMAAKERGEGGDVRTISKDFF